uniref:Major facilitator superfamily (MFS) profile domain-containing protein n=2 Tax=Babesia bovis TaxID=5865 RepID=A7AQZ2_BABBO|eukprot:XP_001610529.1 hypothetical protein [Babesia bovis T2Bo]
MGRRGVVRPLDVVDVTVDTESSTTFSHEKADMTSGESCDTESVVNVAVSLNAVSEEVGLNIALDTSDDAPLRDMTSSGSNDEFYDITLESSDTTNVGDLEAGCNESTNNANDDTTSTSPPSDAAVTPSSIPAPILYDMRRMLFSFALCWFSTFFSHVLRMPLSTTKVSLQRAMNLTTRDLTHLDTSYSICHVLGQACAPAMSARTNSVILVALYQFLMGFVMMLLFAPTSFYYFIIVYGFVGFMAGPTWAVLFSHLSEWLPTEYSFPLITLWFAGSELGSMAGILICIYADSTWGWRSTFVVSGLQNMGIGIMLFCLYDNCKDALSDGRLVDPVSIVRGNMESLWKFIGRLRERTYMETFIEGESNESEPLPRDPHREFILSGLTNAIPQARSSASGFNIKLQLLLSRMYALFSKVHSMTVNYVSVITRVSYMGRIAVSSFTLKLVKHCFCSWVNFYVSTMFGFTPAQGNYLTLTLSVGNCIGNVLVALVCRLFWKGRPLTACTWFFGISAVAVLLFSLMDFSWLITSYACCFLCGVSTTAAEAILMARGIKSLCERSKLNQQESFIVYGFLLAASTLGSVCQGFLVASIVDWYGWSALLGIFVVALMGATVLLFKPSQTES